MKNVWGPNFIPTYAIMAWRLATRMTWSFALHTANVFIQCKISRKIVKGVTGETSYYFLAYFITGNFLNSNINTQIIKRFLCICRNTWFFNHSFNGKFWEQIAGDCIVVVYLQEAIISGEKNLSTLPEMLKVIIRIWDKKWHTKFKILKCHVCAAKRKKKPDMRTDAEG